LTLVISVDENDLKLVLERLDAIKFELFHLRAILLSAEEATDEEKKSIKAAKSNIARGKATNLKNYVSEVLDKSS
jgi:hypothetical protein